MAVRVKKANIRGGPGIGFEIVDEAWRYTPFVVLRRKGKWFEVRDFEGYEGWIHSGLLEDVPSVVVKVGEANVRDGPGLDFPVGWTLERGYSLRVVDREGKWLRIEDGGQVEGWIYRDIVWGDPGPA